MARKFFLAATIPSFSLVAMLPLNKNRLSMYIVLYLNNIYPVRMLLYRSLNRNSVRVYSWHINPPVTNVLMSHASAVIGMVLA
jgi:hypothetical protein